MAKVLQEDFVGAWDFGFKMWNMDSAPSDNELMTIIRAARRGSRKALNDICAWLRPWLEEVSRRRFSGALRTKCPDSDLVQESLIGLTTSIDRFQGQTKSDLMVWVRGIMENKALELHRRFAGTEMRDVQRERRLSLEHSSQPGCHIAETLVPSLERLITAEESEKVKCLVQRLPDHYRQIVELRYLQELSFPEIARQLDRTEASVKHIFVRALEQLAKGLN